MAKEVNKCSLNREGRLRVKRVVLAVGRRLPVYPDNRTYLVSAATSQKCQEQTIQPTCGGARRKLSVTIAWDCALQTYSQ
jgi:hypothetical protein